MNKRVYKKNKKVVEKIIYQRKHPGKKLNFSTLFFFLSIFFFSISLYYFNISFPINNTTMFGMRSIVKQINSTQSVSQIYPSAVPFSPNWQQRLLSKKTKPSSQPKNKKIVAKKKNNSENQIIWHGSRDKKEIALTFDADMTPVMVDWLHDGEVQSYDDTRITDYLTQNQIKATFFLTGLWIESYPDATKHLADSSLFELENHSYSHPSMVATGCFDQPEIPASQYPFEIEKTQQLIEQYTHATPKYFRFPGGCYDQADLDLVKKEGMVTVHWDDVADDGFNDDEQQIIGNVLNEAKPGGIIVMHMGSPLTNVPQTANALPTIIDTLKKEGYTFVTVSELLNPPTIAQITPKKYLTSLESFKNVSTTAF